MTRRDLLTGRWWSRRTLPVWRAPRGEAQPRRLAALPVHRPPGALDESSFLAGCTRCGECIAACPHDAIRLAPPRLRQAAGTPVIDAAVAPCRSCSDRPCAAACQPGVLLTTGPGRMATVSIQPHACLAALGVGCSTCVEQCPVPGALVLEAGRPRVGQDCTGCGTCLHVCPAPAKAILLRPLAGQAGQP